MLRGQGSLVVRSLQISEYGQLEWGNGSQGIRARLLEKKKKGKKKKKKDNKGSLWKGGISLGSICPRRSKEAFFYGGGEHVEFTGGWVQKGL